MTCKVHLTLVLSSIIVLGVLLPACGKKGPLYLPDNAPKAPAATPTPAATPPVQSPSATPPP